MKVGDYVAKITNEWQKHNKWMEFPDEEPIPLGVIVDQSGASWMWDVLTAEGTVVEYNENYLVVISESR